MRRTNITWVDGANQRDIPAFWQQVTSDGTFFKIEELAGGGPNFGTKALGVCMDFDNEAKEFTYLIGFETTADVESDMVEGLVQREVPASKWAVLESVGPLPDSLQSVWGYVMTNFWAESGFEHAPRVPDLEVYSEANPSDPDYKSWIYLPVIEK